MSAKRILPLCALLATVLISRESGAQVFTPSFMAPRQSSDTGLYLSDGPGDFSIEGIWRRMFGDYDLGLRAGLADAGDVTILVGGELRNPIALGADPLDLAVTAAIQGAIADRSAVGFSGGLSIGHTFGSPELTITPYIHPRIGLIKGFRADNFDLELLADLGLDLRLNPRLDVRFGVGIDDNSSNFGVGFAWR